MKKTIFLSLSLILILGGLNIYTDVSAWANKWASMSLEEKFNKKAMLIQKYGQESGLKDKEIKKAQKIQTEIQKVLIQKQAEVDMIKVDIHNLLRADKVKTRKINKLIEKKYEIKEAKAKVIVAGYADLKKIPNDKEWKKIKAAMKKDKKEWAPQERVESSRVKEPEEKVASKAA